MADLRHGLRIGAKRWSPATVPGLALWGDASERVKTGRAVQFIAADASRLEVTEAEHAPGSGGFSVSVWFKPDSLPDQAVTIFERGATNSTGSPGLWMSLMPDGTFRFVLADAGAWLIVPCFAASVGAWNHAVVAVSKQSMLAWCWHNGSLAKEQEISAVGGPIDNPDQPTRFGGYPDSASPRSFAGSVGPSGIWTGRTLGQPEAEALYAGGSGLDYGGLGGSLKTNLVSWWDFSEPSGVRYDRHGTAHLQEAFSDIIGPEVGNGGFESIVHGPHLITGDNSTFDTGTGDWFAPGDASIAHAGDALQVDLGPSAGGAALEGVSTQAGKLYRLRFSHRLISGGPVTAGARNSVSLNNWRFHGTANPARGEFTPGEEWQDEEFQVFCLSPDGGLYLICDTPGASVQFDNVELQEITLENWSVLSEGENTWFVEESGAHEGSRCVRVSIDSLISNFRLHGSNSFTAGKRYYAELYARAADAGTGNIFVRMSGAGNQWTTGSLSDTWALKSGTRAASAGQLTLRPGTADSVVYIDAVALRAAEILSAPGLVSRTARDREAVSQWRPRTGGAPLAQTAAEAIPAWEAAGPAGLPAVKFDGMSDFLSREAVPEITEASPWTVFLVASPAGAGNEWNYLLLNVKASDDRAVIGMRGGGSIVARMSNYGPVSSSAVAFGQPALITAVFSGLELALRVNGSAQAGTNTHAMESVSGLSVGGSSAGSFFSGMIAEWLVYGCALPTAEIARIETYLSAKYTIPLAP